MATNWSKTIVRKGVFLEGNVFFFKKKNIYLPTYIQNASKFQAQLEVLTKSWNTLLRLQKASGFVKLVDLMKNTNPTF